MKKFVPSILISVMWGLLRSMDYIGTNEHVYLSDIIMKLSFCKTEFVPASLIDMSFQMFPHFIFQAIYGIYLYQHFCTASVYYFSRYPHRIAWFIKELIQLYTIIIQYFLFLVISCSAAVCFENKLVLNTTDLIVFLYYLVIYSFWMFFAIVLINLLSIKFGSGNAFSFVCGGQLVSIASLFMWHRYLLLSGTEKAARNMFFLKLNPAAHLVFDWHSSNLEEINMKFNRLGHSFSLNETCAGFILLCIIAVIAGCYIIDTQELFHSDLENGGI